jgi:SOS response regulatory protein OraA/RecX
MPNHDTQTQPLLSLKSLRSKALAMLTRREHSQFELQTKLAELGADPTQISTIINELISQSWQSDRVLPKFLFALMHVKVKVHSIFVKS